jgi:site-specific DNA recombinase
MSRCSATPLASNQSAAHRSPAAAPGAGDTGGPAPADPPAAPAATADDRYLTLAALYARVSTERQEKEATIASQLDLLQQAAAQRGYTVPAEYIFTDEGYSGTRLDRPALERLRDLAATGAFEVVLVLAPDRLARQYAYQVVVLDELTRAGCRVEFLNHAFGASPQEPLLLQIQGVFAEYERAVIQERMRRGRLFAARQGRISWGRAPYGYRYIRKTPELPQQVLINEPEAAVVRQIYQWLLEEQLSSYALAERLTEQGIPTRLGRSERWRQSAIWTLLRNPVYKGVAYYNRTQTVDAHQPHLLKGFKDRRPGNGGSRAERPREDWIALAVPALVDPETWDLAQEQLARNREQARRNNHVHSYLLRGLLVCGRCGRRLVGMWNQAGGGSYVCSARYASRQGPLPRCPGRSVGRERIERAVWEYVQTLLADPDLLRAQYAAGQADPAVDGPAAASRCPNSRAMPHRIRGAKEWRAGTVAAE